MSCKGAVNYYMGEGLAVIAVIAAKETTLEVGVKLPGIKLNVRSFRLKSKNW